MTITAVLFLMS